MHMRFLSRGFKNLQWYGMTDIHRNLDQITVDFLYFAREGLWEEL